MNIYKQLQTVADGLIKDFSQSTDDAPIIHRKVEKFGPPESPTTTVTDASIDATVTGVSRQYIAADSRLEGALVVTFSANSTTPGPDDKWVINGDQYETIQVDQRPATGIPVVYAVIIKR